MRAFPPQQHSATKLLTATMRLPHRFFAKTIMGRIDDPEEKQRPPEAPATSWNDAYGAEDAEQIRLVSSPRFFLDERTPIREETMHGELHR